MPKDKTTGNYELDIAITIIEKNHYGDAIRGGEVHFSTSTACANLAQVGLLFQRLQDAVDQ